MVYSSFVILVIQECSTDSEELLHASECGDTIIQQKENIMHHNIESMNTHTITKTPIVKGNLIKSKRLFKDHDIRERNRNELQERLQKRHSIATTHNLEQLENSRSKYNKISCDVSLEDSFEKSQPINFTFTLYDLEGHGIITKEDIASIVSTIYDSIGKTMVAPAYGKKVINVKLTMSPQDLIKSNEQNHKIRRHMSSAHKHLRSNLCENEPKSENIVPVMKLKNDINSHELPRNSENFDGEKNNLYESINNLKSYKPAIENILSKNNKNENIELRNCLETNASDKMQLDRNDESKNLSKNNVGKKRNRKQRAQKQKVII